VHRTRMFQVRRITKHMKFVAKTILVLAFALPSFAFAVTDGGVPGIPHQFYGTALYSNGSAVPNGVVVEAKVGSSVVGRSIVASGKYGVAPSVLFATKSSGNWSGETAAFYVDGMDTGVTAALSMGGYTQKNLTIPAATTPSAPTSGGGGGGGIMVVLQATVVSGKADSNNDGKVDIFDFNAMMVNWGKTGTNIAGDINNDGRLDIFDFNLLMIQWTS